MPDWGKGKLRGGGGGLGISEDLERGEVTSSRSRKKNKKGHDPISFDFKGIQGKLALKIHARGDHET